MLTCDDLSSNYLTVLEQIFFSKQLHTGLYTVDDVLTYMDIPMPEDNDLRLWGMSGRWWGQWRGWWRWLWWQWWWGRRWWLWQWGYSDGNNSSDVDNSSGLPKYTQHLSCTYYMTIKAPIDCSSQIPYLSQLSSKPICSFSNIWKVMSCHTTHGYSSGFDLYTTWQN